MILKTLVAVLFIAIATASFSDLSQGQSIVFKQIALSGDVGQGITDGTKFESFDVPAINSKGEIAFIAKFSEDPEGHVSKAVFGPIGDGGPPSLICRTGQTAFGVTDGALFDNFSVLTMNDKSDLTFKSTLAGSNGEKLPADISVAIFGPTAGAGSPLGMLVRSGDTISAGSIRNDAKVSYIGTPSINNNGKVVFLSGVRETKKKKETGATIICGPVAGSKSAWGLLASTGSAVAGLADGEKITRLFSMFTHATINDRGAVSTFAWTEKGVVVLGPARDGGLQLSALAKEGQKAMGAKDGELFDFRKFHPIRASADCGTSLNEHDDVTFVAGLRTGQGAEVTDDNDMAIFGPTEGPGSALGIIFREGDAAIGVTDDPVFGRLIRLPQINDSGDIAFHCVLKTGSGDVINTSSDDAIFGPTEGAGSPVGLIARDGDVAPGATDGAVFNLEYYFGPVINNRGSTAFFTDLRTGDGGRRVNQSKNDKAIFVYADQKLRMVVRTGERFEVIPETGDTESRTISKVILGYLQANNILNDKNTIVFLSEFTDGTSGIFTATVPALATETEQEEELKASKKKRLPRQIRKLTRFASDTPFLPDGKPDLSKITYRHCYDWQASKWFDDPQVVELCKAIEREDLDAIDALVAAGVDINTRGVENITPLMWSMPPPLGTNLLCMRRLLEHGANPNVKLMGTLGTPGHFLSGDSVTSRSATAKLATLKLVLEHGGDTAIEEHNHYTLIGLVIARPLEDKEDRIDLILGHGADINQPTGRQWEYAATHAVGYGGQYGLALFLLERGAAYDRYRVLDGGRKLIDEVYLRSRDKDMSKNYPYQAVVKFLEDRGETLANSAARFKYRSAMRERFTYETYLKLRKAEEKVLIEKQRHRLAKEKAEKAGVEFKADKKPLEKAKAALEKLWVINRRSAKPTGFPRDVEPFQFIDPDGFPESSDSKSRDVALQDAAANDPPPTTSEPLILQSSPVLQSQQTLQSPQTVYPSGTVVPMPSAPIYPHAHP